MKIGKKAEEVVFILLVILLPSQLSKHFWPSSAFISGIRLDYLSPTLYFTDLLIIALLMLGFINNRNKKKKTTKKSQKKHFKILAASFVFILANTIFSTRLSVTIYSWIRIVELLFLFIYLTNASQSIISKFYKTLPIPVIYSSLIALVQFIKQNSIGGLLYWIGERRFTITTPGIAKTSFAGKLLLRPYATFPHPNALAGFVLACLILLLLKEKDFLKTKFGIITFVLGTISLLLTLSQITWLISIFLLIIFSIKKQVKAKIVVIPLSIIITVVLFNNFPLEKESISLRITQTRQAIKIIKDSPIIGVGLGNFIPALSVENHFINFKTSLFLYYQPVHNFYLLLASEVGILGLLFALVFISKTLLILWQRRKNYLFTTLLVILIIGIVDHYWLTLYQNRLLFTFILALAWKKS